MIEGDALDDMVPLSRPDQVPSGEEAYEAFFRRESRRLVGLAYALSGSRLAADDIAQEALLAAYKRWEEVGRLDNPGAWARRVVANKSVSAFRKRMSETKSLARLAMHRPLAVLPELDTETEWLWKEVRRLPSRQVQIIALRYYGQLSMSEIADTLGCSKETVNTHLRRARETLTRRLGSQGELP